MTALSADASLTSGAVVLVAVAAAALASLLAVRRPASHRLAAGLAGRLPPPGHVDDPPGGPASTLQRLRGAAALGAGVCAGLLLPGWYAVAGALVAGALVWRHSAGWEDRGVRRRREQLESDVVHVVDLLSAAVSAGAAPAHALHEVTRLVDGVTADTLRRWSRRLRWGSEPVQVWADMAAHDQLGRLGQVLLRSATSGAPISEALSRLAEDERDRQRGQVEARVRQIEVKAAAPLGLCLLPAFVLLGIVPLVAGSVTGLVLQ